MVAAVRAVTCIGCHCLLCAPKPLDHPPSTAGLDHVLAFSLDGKNIFMNHFRVTLKKSASRLPLVQLNEIGPALKWTLRRTRWAAPDLMQQAMRLPKQLIKKKEKNVEYTGTGDKLGRVHLGRQVRI